MECLAAATPMSAEARLAILDECRLSAAESPRSVRARVFRLLFVQRPDDPAARGVEWFIVCTIIVSIIAMAWQTMSGLQPELREVLLATERVAVTIFAVEYVLRLWSVTASSRFRSPVGGRFRYAVTFFALVDLVSLAPLLSWIFGIDIALLGFARLARLLKLGRYSTAVRTLIAVLTSRRDELAASFAMLGVMLFVSAAGIYFMENEAQPEAFGSIPLCLWWSVVTLTTLGYGDVAPITAGGRIFAGVSVLVGILMIAIPTGIVSAGFYEEFRRDREPPSGACPHCGRRPDDAA